MCTTRPLSDGRLIVPFAELSDGQATCKVHLLYSDDDGQKWPFEHYGYACLLPLGDDEVIACFRSATIYTTPSRA